MPGYSTSSASLPDLLSHSQYLTCQSCRGSIPPTNTIVAGKFARLETSTALGPLTLAAQWSRLAPSGRKALQCQSARAILMYGSFPYRISDSVRSDPPKKGWIAISPLTLTCPGFSCAALTATWCAMFPPALSPAMKHLVTSAFPGSSEGQFSAMNLRASNPSSYWEGNRCSGVRRYSTEATRAGASPASLLQKAS